MRKRIILGAIAGAVAAAFATPATYDDIGKLRPSGDANEFWTTSGHPGAAIDYYDSSAVPIDARLPEKITASAGACDLRWVTSWLSDEVDFDSNPVGFMLFLR